MQSSAGLMLVSSPSLLSNGLEAAGEMNVERDATTTTMSPDDSMIVNFGSQIRLSLCIFIIHLSRLCCKGAGRPPMWKSSRNDLLSNLL